jgi:hypothetical protein
MGCVRRTKLRETLAERKRESADVRFAEALVHGARARGSDEHADLVCDVGTGNVS